MAYACNPCYFKDRDSRVQGQTEKKVSKNLPQRISQKLWYTPIILATWESHLSESQSKASPRQNHKTLSEK
jgi:hypothetical protein